MVVEPWLPGTVPVGKLPADGVPPVVVVTVPVVQMSCYPTDTRFFLSPAMPDFRTAPEIKFAERSARTQRTDRVLVFMLS
jgi:hypothetical protein